MCVGGTIYVDKVVGGCGCGRKREGLAGCWCECVCGWMGMLHVIMYITLFIYLTNTACLQAYHTTLAIKYLSIHVIMEIWTNEIK